jgi:MoaA/NifB/PqqE/SkfB family radical SAM enzyme
MRFHKIYLEISNICNLKCSFCPGTKRKKKRLTEEEFAALMPKLRPWSDFLYFHLMGEPLCHPNLKKFLNLAHDIDFKVIITTNGTLLKKQQATLLEAEGLHKVNISLQSFEANTVGDFESYVNLCAGFAARVAEKGKIAVLRLWNEGGANAKNQEILQILSREFAVDIQNLLPDGRGNRKIASYLYLESAEKFDWPDLQAPEDTGELFCYGLRDQIGILCDGTVVPCCLDHNGDIPLGNLYTQNLEEILNSPRAIALYDGFSRKTPSEDLCRRCGYARRFR